MNESLQGRRRCSATAGEEEGGWCRWLPTTTTVLRLFSLSAVDEWNDKDKETVHTTTREQRGEVTVLQPRSFITWGGARRGPLFLYRLRSLSKWTLFCVLFTSSVPHDCVDGRLVGHGMYSWQAFSVNRLITSFIFILHWAHIVCTFLGLSSTANNICFIVLWVSVSHSWAAMLK